VTWSWISFYFRDKVCTDYIVCSFCLLIVFGTICKNRIFADLCIFNLLSTCRGRMRSFEIVADVWRVSLSVSESSLWICISFIYWQLYHRFWLLKAFCGLNYFSSEILKCYKLWPTRLLFIKCYIFTYNLLKLNRILFDFHPRFRIWQSWLLFCLFIVWRHWWWCGQFKHLYRFVESHSSFEFFRVVISAGWG